MTRRLILASASPRRQELLQDLSYPFDIVAANCEEYFDRSLPIAAFTGYSILKFPFKEIGCFGCMTS